MNRVELIAHRGSHRRAPENSLAAIRAALNEGADAIELDVHATEDGVVVVHHDATLPSPDAGAPENRRIAELGFAMLEAFPLEDGSTIPSLSEVLKLVDNDAHVYVEIKARNIEPIVLACVEECGGGASIHSFDHRIVKTCAELNGRIDRGILLESYLVDTRAAMNAAKARDLWQYHELIDADLVALVHAAEGRLIAWTVNDGDDAARLAALGVDAICTDDIGAVRRAVA